MSHSAALSTNPTASPDDPAPHPLSGLPGFVLRRAANAMMTELAARLATIDMRISEATAVLLIGWRDDLTSSDIGKMLDIQRANMVPLLARLDAAGLIERQPINRKSHAIVLTEAGRARLAQVREITERFEVDLVSRIPAAHRGHLLPALNALID